MKTLIITIVFCLFGSISFAKEQGSVKLSQNEKKFLKAFNVEHSKRKPQSISNQAVQKVLATDYPKKACQKKSSLAKCYKVKNSQCQSAVSQSLSACFNEVKSSRNLSSLETKIYSQNVGACVKKKYPTYLKGVKNVCK